MYEDIKHYSGVMFNKIEKLRVEMKIMIMIYEFVLAAHAFGFMWFL